MFTQRIVCRSLRHCQIANFVSNYLSNMFFSSDLRVTLKIGDLVYIFHLLCITQTDAGKSVTCLALMYHPKGYTGDSSILQDPHKT